MVVDDRPHADEHSLEVHLPFLQVALGDGWSVVPIVVGQVPVGEVADLLELLWGGPETLVVVSTDLSHYHDQDTARGPRRRHRGGGRGPALATTSSPTGPAARSPSGACWPRPSAGASPVELLDLRTSGDTAGDQRRVVGYGAFTVG